MKEIVFALEQERARRGLTIDAWAEYLDMPRTSYCGWIYFRRRPSLERLMKVLHKAGFKLAVVKEGAA